jgi:hypothetical protein
MLASGIQVINGGKIQGDLYEGPKNHKENFHQWGVLSSPTDG